MGMSVKKYRVKLPTEERQELKALVSRGRGLLRIPAQGGEQPFHVVRSAGRTAPGGSDGPAYEGRLGPGGQAPVDEDYSHQDRIVPVMDNPVPSAGQALNTPQPRCTRDLNLPKRGASPNGWRSTTLPSL